MKNSEKKTPTTYGYSFAIRCVLLVLWVAMLVLVSYFSAQSAEKSTAQSIAVGKAICSVVINDYEKLSFREQYNYASAIDHFVRKEAHFTEYAVLGALTLNTLYMLYRLLAKFSEKAAVLKKQFPLRSLLALGFCFLYASADEIHQLFVSGRSASPIDVLIDTSGAALGIAVILLISLLIRKAKLNKSAI